VLLAYNQERFVRQSVESCLAQQCEALEIVLSDDASTDDTYAQMQDAAAAYRGPHHIVVRRNATNVGIGEHYNQLVAASRGELLVTATGDDLSTPDRVHRLLQAWESTGCRADLIASHVVDMDEAGRLHAVKRVDDLSSWHGVDDWIERRPYIIGAGHAFTRRLMTRFGPLDPGVFYEDQIMVFRAIVSGGAVTVDAPLVHYRRGGTSRLALFESVDHMHSWEQRRRNRETAEMNQLIRDAAVAGCESAVHAALRDAAERRAYLDRLQQADGSAARWREFSKARNLPLAWRLKKWLHVAAPSLALPLRRLAAKRRSDGS
jgi:glycosyltransferase involved in cell wall biosynthesis